MDFYQINLMSVKNTVIIIQYDRAFYPKSYGK